MITFKKINYSEIPEALAKRVLSWSEKEIQIDNTGLTRVQMQKLIDYMLQEGYKET